jgi:hypothetical protein
MDTAPERTCVVTRTVHEPEELIRFVCGPDGHIVPDLARRLPGRGVWVGCARATVQAAVKTGAFARSLRRQVTVAPDLPDAVEKLMLRRVMDALSLANKAGLALAGFAKVEEAITAGHCVALLHASDAAEDGAGKLDRKFRAIWAAKGLAGEPTIVRGLASAELSLAMGRSNVVHAALNRGGAASNFLNEAERLQRYRASPDVQARSPEAGAKTDQA